MRRILSLGAAGVLLTACGGTELGTGGFDLDGGPRESGTGTGGGGPGSGGSPGTGGTGGSSGGSGGTAGAAGSGGSYDPCAKRPCGATCSVCDPNDPECVQVGVVTMCNEQGQCTPTFPACQVPQCGPNQPCVQPGAPCQQCPDGSFACPSVECVNGQCVGSFPTCKTQTCTLDGDCPVSLAPCRQCPDGGLACPWARCENGTCTSGIDSCGGDPCAGKQCGDSCSLCGDVGCGSPVATYCDANLKCQLSRPTCGNVCKLDTDCPGVGACPPCPDGSCAEYKCIEGACAFTCATKCGGAGQACCADANGTGSCIGALMCCVGVPYPQGGECNDRCELKSDRNAKWEIVPVEPQTVLDRVGEMAVTSWSYRGSDVRHIGPMAQDFHAAFPYGSNKLAIDLGDANGVALVAIQALNAHIQLLERENTDLQQQLEDVRHELRSSRSRSRGSQEGP